MKMANPLSLTSVCFLLICIHRVAVVGFGCTEYYQSPIKIENFTENDSFFDLIHTEPYLVEPKRIKVIKNANVGLFRLEPGYDGLSKPKLVGGPLTNPYILQHVDFHWGEHDEIGSEHTFEELRFPMEIQTVHYNEKYANLLQAMKNTDGIAVVSYFAVISQQPNDAISRIIEKYNDLAHPGTRSADLTTRFSMSQLLPPFSDDYFAYKGTYINSEQNICARNVDWIIQPRPILISAGQINLFRGFSKNAAVFLNNYGQQTPRNGRTIHYIAQKSERVREILVCRR